jgi:regulator of sigma E protease
MLENLLTSPYFIWPVSILAACFLFSLAVFIHEFGHFIAARLLGLRADVFSIGFGPALWKRQIGATELRLSAIPFGGYVSLPQLDPDGMKQIQGDHGETLPPATPWRRIIVAVAGPLGNIFLAVVCAAMIAWFSPIEATGASTEVGYVEADSSGWNAGLRRGDKILAVNDEVVTSWTGFMTECFLSGGTNDVVRITYQRGSETHTAEAVLDKQISETESIYGVSGLRPGPISLGISEVMPNSPAERAGLQAGDIITKVNNIPFDAFEQITQIPTPIEHLTLEILRNKETITFDVVPEVLPELGETPKMGIALAFFAKANFQWMAERGIYAQLKSDVMGVTRVLRALTAPKTEGERGRAAKGLGGPLMIFTVFIQVIQTGLWVSLGFLRLICMNLAILNLLPLPVLDGGHILFASCAVICRRELPPKVISWITMSFSILLIGAMIWFLFADVRRMVLQFF